MGAVGSGKTSFFSSIDSAFKGRLAHREESLATKSGDASISKKQFFSHNSDSSGLLDNLSNFHDTYVAVSESQKPVLCDPWRKIHWEDRNAMVEKARTYSTGSNEISKANILLLGGVGSGKTSFSSSVDSAFKGRISQREDFRGTTAEEASVTHNFRILRPGGGNAVNFTLCDTMGMREAEGIDLADLPYILDGHTPHNYKFNHVTLISHKSPGFIESPTMAEKMHCIVYIVNACIVDREEREILARFLELRKQASSRNIRIVILVTHIDEVCAEVKASVRNAYKSEAVKEIVGKISGLTGIPILFIYLAKNYSYEGEVDPYIDALNITALQKMLDCATDFLGHDP